MAEVVRHRPPPTGTWSVLLKIIAAAVAVYLWFLLWRIVLLMAAVLIVSAGLKPVVAWLERRGSPRTLAAATVTLAIAAAFAAFVAVTWNSLSSQAQSLGQQTQSIERQLAGSMPAPLADVLRRSGETGTSIVGKYIDSLGRTVLTTMSFLVLGLILVMYLLVERETTYRWIRAFVPERHRQRFDRTATDAAEASAAYLLGNLVTSACAAIYVVVVLGLLKVPGVLLLAVIAFVADLFPVLGFVLSVVPAMIMAASISATMTLLMIPAFLFYDFLENYFIAPYVYGNRLRLSTVAVVLAFTIGAELAGVVGALIALPLAAIYPSIERNWLRDRLSAHAVDEHERLAGEHERGPLSQRRSS
jgi:predicted PurR-regulated permease PerM